MSQFKYKFEKYDFKRFIHESSPERFRSEKFIFWVRDIPLPEELIFKIFEDRGVLLSIYIDHVASILFLLKWGEDTDTVVKLLKSYPAVDNPYSISDYDIETVLKINIQSINNCVSKIAELLQLENYRLNVKSIARALRHKGRKYSRLFLPAEIRIIIEEYIPEFNYSSFSSQSDMYGNVIADQYNIYRSGFSDAFAILFNKLLEFLIAGFNHCNNNVTSVPRDLKLLINNNIKINDIINFEISSVFDGSLWEPAFVKNKIGFFLDKESVEIFEMNSGIDELGLHLIQALSELELNAYSDSERKKIDYIRRDISRMIKSRINNLKN